MRRTTSAEGSAGAGARRAAFASDFPDRAFRFVAMTTSLASPAPRAAHPALLGARRAWRIAGAQ
jgi:hypothetical protein